MSNLIEIQTDENNKVTVPTIEYQGKKVITTELLAKLYGTEAKVIRKNHERNLDRFTENTHYFKLTGEILKQFKNNSLTTERLNDVQSIVGLRATSLML